jgi:hypothetical protein
MTPADALPEDLPHLRAAALALIAERDELLRRIERMHDIIRQFQRAQFGRHSERLDPDQLQLGLEEREIANAQEQAAAEKQGAGRAPGRFRANVNRYPPICRGSRLSSSRKRHHARVAVGRCT